MRGEDRDAFNAYQREYQRRYRAAHIERIREQARERTAKYRLAHPEATRATWAKWVASHPDRIRAPDPWGAAAQAWRDARKKARALGVEVGDLTREHFARLQLLPCEYCGVLPAGSTDHVIPFARGGTNTLLNLVPSCKTCNRRKGPR